MRITDARALALIDSGTSINMVSPCVAGCKKLPRLPVCPSIHIGQAFHPTGVLAKEKISATISIPLKNWTSKKPANLLVAPLTNSETVLGMPFLAQEQIKVYFAIRHICLRTPKARKALPTTMRPLNLKRTETKPVRPDLWLITDHGNKPHLTGTSLGITPPWKPVLSQDDI